MPTTSNFGWTTPADTDLVKDGALAIRTLGNGIDSSLLDLKGGTTGQILSKASNTDLDYTWINNDQGDITEVQAGTGISVASGTGPVPIVTNTVATAFDAKGDLVAGTGADTFSKLTVGANNTVLMADSTTATGLKWGTVSSDPAFCGTLVTNNATQSFPSGAYTTATFNTETYDSDAFHSTTTNTGRLTVPSGKGGYYYIFSWANPDDSTAFEWIHTIDVNGTTIGRSRGYKTASAQASSTFVYTVRNLAVGDYVTTTIYQASGGNRTFNFGDTGVQGGFGMFRIGA